MWSETIKSSNGSATSVHVQPGAQVGLSYLWAVDRNELKEVGGSGSLRLNF